MNVRPTPSTRHGVCVAIVLTAALLLACAANGRFPGAGGAAQEKKAEAPPVAAMAPPAPMDRPLGAQLPDGPPPKINVPAPQREALAKDALADGEMGEEEGQHAEPVARAVEARAEPAAMDMDDEMDAGAADWGGDGDGLEWAWEVDGPADINRGWDGGRGGGNWAQPEPVREYAPVRSFPVPDYSQPHDGPRTDFRETVYWNPQVRTDANGQATVRFALSDAVTTFAASVEGIGASGRVGRGEGTVRSALPVSLAVSLPSEVNRGDRIELPIVLANDSDATQTATLSYELGDAFELVGDAPAGEVQLASGERKAMFLAATVVGDGRREKDGLIRVSAKADALSDSIERTVRVVPEGFPFEVAAGGALEDERPVTHTVKVDRALTGTLDATIKLYPNPVSGLVSGTESMIRQPGGCFEQASSSNYPNIMILQHLESHGEVDPELVQRTQGYLDSGYQLLTGYETPEKGYEWFGGAPGHEALTAYGLMEFVEMDQVFDVDDAMIERTRTWLLSKRDGEGGYVRNDRALDSFGSASPAVTDAYITWALTEAGERNLATELAPLRDVAENGDDPYVLALAANALLNVDATDKDGAKAIERLVAMQGDDGNLPGADHSITRSGGIALAVETTSLAALAFMKAPTLDRDALDDAIGFIQSQSNGWGGYGSTQSTILGLKALTAHSRFTAKLPAGTSILVMINGKEAANLEIDGNESGDITIGGVGHLLREGKNTVELVMDSEGEDEVQLPYSMALTWRSKQPQPSRESKVDIETEISADRVSQGESVRLAVDVTNLDREGLPMVLARVGVPGGLTYQTWQLEELRDTGVIDFYETREREVILYWRDMAPSATERVNLDLLAHVPGEYEAPASSAYLYYTDEHKDWEAPSRVTITAAADPSAAPAAEVTQ